MLTGTRRGESGSLTWANVDFDARTFHLPGDIVKNSNGITLPMSTVMHALLTERLALVQVEEKKRRRAESPYVFPSTGATGYVQQAQATMEAVSEVAGMHITIHDLRRTFVDVCAEVGVSADRERMLLNHLTGDVHARHYQNSSKTLTAEVEKVAQWIAATDAV